jgi:Domain of unknown function (DUF5979)
MRNSRRLFIVVAMVGGSIALAAGPGSAGGPSSNFLTVEKVVVGTAPAGTTFTVEVDCQSDLGPGAAVIPTVTFDATGQATSNNMFNVPAGQSCTVTETATGGASSVGYACDMVRGQTDQTEPYLGYCASDNVATFTDVIGDSATITVTNTFVAPPTPAAAAVQIAPTFTG